MKKSNGYIKFVRFSDILDFLKSIGINDPFEAEALKELNPRLRHPVDLMGVWFKYEKGEIEIKGQKPMQYYNILWASVDCKGESGVGYGQGADKVAYRIVKDYFVQEFWYDAEIVALPTVNDAIETESKCFFEVAKEKFNCVKYNRRNIKGWVVYDFYMPLEKE